MTYSYPCYFGMHDQCDEKTTFTDYDGHSHIWCGCHCHSRPAVWRGSERGQG